MSYPTSADFHRASPLAWPSEESAGDRRLPSCGIAASHPEGSDVGKPARSTDSFRHLANAKGDPVNVQGLASVKDSGLAGEFSKSGSCGVPLR